jgi:cytochrome o ubiquinol oxidase subunit 3
MSAQAHTIDAAPAAFGYQGVRDSQAFGFWLYILSDLILFSALFATFAMQMHSFAGGPTGRELFDLRYVFRETLLLLLSSAAYGLAVLAMQKERRAPVPRWLGITFLLGLGFILMEIHELHHLIAEGNGPDRSGFLSAYFTLVGTHGTHVSFGLIWMAVLMFQVALEGLSVPVQGRLLRLSVFWHFLDIVWVGGLLRRLPVGGDAMTQHTTIAGEAHGNLQGCARGFALSLILTAIPFGLVMIGSAPKSVAIAAIFIAAAAQILVHLRYFLHMDQSSAQRWNLMTFLFTTLVMAIFIGGSLWIMYNLHYRMVG